MTDKREFTATEMDVVIEWLCQELAPALAAVSGDDTPETRKTMIEICQCALDADGKFGSLDVQDVIQSFATALIARVLPSIGGDKFLAAHSLATAEQIIFRRAKKGLRGSGP